MGQLFIKVLNLSIVAGWLVLAISFLRAVFRKVPKWIYCSLWALVGLRLIIPFSLKSMFSVIPSAETIPQDIIYSQTPEVHTGFAAANSLINPVIKDTFSPAIGDSVNPLQIWMEVIGTVWLIGIAGMLVFALVSYLKLKKKTLASVILRDENIDFEKTKAGDVNVKNKKDISYPVYVCDDINSPFILGLFRPKIFVPSGIDQVNLKSVYSHEMAHIKRKDFLWKPLGFLLLSVYWFNPLMWLAYILLCRDIEAACDEKVINNMDAEERAEYSQVLLNCETHNRRFSVCPLSFGETGVKSRVKSILNYKKPAFWIILVALAACVVIGICFLTNPKGKTDDGDKEIDISEENKNIDSKNNIENRSDKTSDNNEAVVDNHDGNNQVEDNPEKNVNIDRDNAGSQRYEELFYDYHNNQSKILGMYYKDVSKVYGEPSGHLSGFWGDIYDNGNGEQLILYFDSDKESENYEKVYYIKKFVPGAGMGYNIFKEILGGNDKLYYCENDDERLVTIDDILEIVYPKDEYSDALGAKIWLYSFCDLEGDGAEEAILQLKNYAAGSGEKIILHKMGDKIYAYKTGEKDLWELKEDGTYSYTNSQMTEDGFARIIAFTENGYTVDKYSYETGKYKGNINFVVNHNTASYSQYQSEVEWQDKKERVHWYEFDKEFFREPNPTQTPEVSDSRDKISLIIGKTFKGRVWPTGERTEYGIVFSMTFYEDGTVGYTQPSWSSRIPKTGWSFDGDTLKVGGYRFEISAGELIYHKDDNELSFFGYYEADEGTVFSADFKNDATDNTGDGSNATTDMPTFDGYSPEEGIGWSRISKDIAVDEDSIRGKIYVCTDDGYDTQNKLSNKTLELRLYSDGTATYSQPLYSSLIPVDEWSVEDNIVTIHDGNYKNILEIVDGDLKFIEEGSSGFMFYQIPDGTLFKWAYNLIAKS